MLNRAVGKEQEEGESLGKTEGGRPEIVYSDGGAGCPREVGVTLNSLGPLEDGWCHYRHVYRSWGSRGYLLNFSVPGPLLIEKNPRLPEVGVMFSLLSF